MANFAANEVKKYMENLTATSAICTSFGTTFTSGTNLFMPREKGTDVDMMTIIPTSGGPPLPSGDQGESACQIRIKTALYETGLRTMQEVINTLHENTKVCASQPGKVIALQSQPIPLDSIEGGKFNVTVANFHIRHVKF